MIFKKRKKEVVVEKVEKRERNVDDIYETKILIKQNLNSMSQSCNLLQRKIDSYVKEAKTAKVAGESRKYNNLVSLIQKYMFVLENKKKICDQYNFLLEELELNNSCAKMTNLIDAIAQNFQNSVKKINTNDVVKKFEGVVMDNLSISNKFNEMFEKTSSFIDVADNTNTISIDEIEKMIMPANEDFDLDERVTYIKNKIQGMV